MSKQCDKPEDGDCYKWDLFQKWLTENYMELTAYEISEFWECWKAAMLAANRSMPVTPPKAPFK